MGEGIYYAQTEDPGRTVAELEWPDESYMYLERVPQTWLSADEIAQGLQLARLDSAESWRDWERAILFCARFELRWEWLDGTFNATYTGADGAPTGFTLASDGDLADAEIQDIGYDLWGNRVPQAALPDIGIQPDEGQRLFVAFTVPRVLSYPVSETARSARLRVRHYRDAATGRTLAYRFCGLEEVEAAL